MWTHRRSGQIHQRGHLDHRNPYERDRTRVIHCPAFRRLQRKTQILGTAKGDFHRTRLTHSLEVASIGASIVHSLRKNYQDSALNGLLPDDDLISVICLLHDIGHPPFGHGGEVALNYMMRAHGGFEGNAQTLRLLLKLETSYGDYGLDLTRRSLLGILKYPAAWSRVAKTKAESSMGDSIRINDWLPPKAYFDSEQAEVDWLLEPLQAADSALFQSLAQAPTQERHGQTAYHSFDCSIMDIADDIAYGVHDLEDAVHLRLIRREQFDSAELRDILAKTPWGHQGSNQEQRFLDYLFANSLSMRKDLIGEMVNYFIASVDIVLLAPSFEHLVFQYGLVMRPEARALLDYCMRCIYDFVINSQEARIVEYAGQKVVQALFEAFSANPEHLLDPKNRDLYCLAKDKTQAYRVICDYIANMTDEYAYRMHERLFGLSRQSIFERL